MVFSLTKDDDYASRKAAIARQEKLAKMLSQMGAQEIPVSSAGGISAPISPMSALAKGLSSFGGSYLAGQAENKAKDYENSKLSDALMAKMAGSGIDPNTLSSATSTTPEQPGFFDRAANFLGMGGNQEKPAIAGPAAPANTPTAPIDAEGTPTGTYMLPPTPASAPQPKNDAEGTPTSSYMPSQQPDSPNAAPVLPYLAKLDQQAKYYTAYKPTTLQGRIDQQTGLIGIQQNKKDYLDNLPRYQALLAAAPPENRPQLQAAINTNNTALLDKYEGTQLDKSTPQAVNQSIEISADASGVPPNARRPGDRYYKMPDGQMKVVSGSDMSSPGKRQSDIDVARAKAADRYFIQGGGPQVPITVDPTSKSLNGVTGLSQLAIDRLMNAPNQPRARDVVTRVDKEISDYSINNNVNLSTMRSKAIGIQNTLTNNVERNNQANILDQELSASIDIVTPYLDKIDLGKINKANVASIWAGRQVNDGNAQIVADQLSRARDELAGYNAVAGGHLTVQGRPDPTPKNYAEAEKVILDGITSGGARNVAKSISMSAAKNRQILNRSVQDADYQLWDALGKGTEYKKNFGYDPEARGGVADQNASSTGVFASKEAAEAALKAKGHKLGESVKVTINGQTGTLVLH